MGGCKQELAAQLVDVTGPSLYSPLSNFYRNIKTLIFL